MPNLIPKDEPCPVLSLLNTLPYSDPGPHSQQLLNIYWVYREILTLLPEEDCQPESLRELRNNISEIGNTIVRMLLAENARTSDFG